MSIFQLVAFGAQDKYLTDNPSSAFFHVIYKPQKNRYTRYYGEVKLCVRILYRADEYGYNNAYEVCINRHI